MQRTLILAGLSLAVLCAAPASGQVVGAQRLSVEPYVAYGFFGDLPNGPSLEADVAFGGRAAFQLAPQWALYGAFQRATPSQALLGGGSDEVTVDHWSAGVEFAYVPRGGAEGVLPLLLEAGLGQVRYEGASSSLAANVGVGSALELSPGFAIRYGVNDYISNYEDEGIVNQVFGRVGLELSF